MYWAVFESVNRLLMKIQVIVAVTVDGVDGFASFPPSGIDAAPKPRFRSSSTVISIAR